MASLYDSTCSKIIENEDEFVGKFIKRDYEPNDRFMIISVSPKDGCNCWSFNHENARASTIKSIIFCYKRYDTNPLKINQESSDSKSTDVVFWIRKASYRINQSLRCHVTNIILI